MVQATEPSLTTSAPMPPGTAHVVVGDDGSRHARRVVEHALGEADRLGLALTVLTLVQPVVDPDRSISAQLREERAATEQADRRLQGTIAQLRERRAEGTVRGVLLVNPDDATLGTHLARCALVVVGSRGPVGQQAFSLGTTSRRLLKAARCPALVVPRDVAPPAAGGQGMVVAGLDTWTPGQQVLREAAAAAATRGGHLQVVCSYRGEAGESAEQALARAGAACEQQVRAAGLDPGLSVTRVITAEPPAAALTRIAQDAALLVVGSRGALALAGLASESVSRAVLQTMPAPVLVVPRPQA